MYKISNNSRQTIPVFIIRGGVDTTVLLGYRGDSKVAYSEKMTVHMKSLLDKGLILVKEETKEAQEKVKKAKYTPVKKTKEDTDVWLREEKDQEDQEKDIFLGENKLDS